MQHLARLMVAAALSAAMVIGTSVLTLPAHGKLWSPRFERGADPTADLEQFEHRVLIRVNRARARRGLPRVRAFESCLDQTSEQWAQRLRGSRDLVHRDQTWVLRRCDLRWTGENLVRGTSLTPAAAVRAWLNSPSHRAVLLKKRARWAGVGARVDGSGRVVGVLNFGDPT